MRASFVGGDVPDSGAYEHEGTPAVGEAAHDAGTPSDLLVKPFDYVASADTAAVLIRELV